MSVKYATFKSNTGAIGAFLILKYAGAGLADVAAAATAPLAGVSEHGCSAVGDALSVAVEGQGAQVTSGEAIAAGDYLTSDANGKAIKATTVGQYCIGVAEEDAAGIDEIIVYRPGLSIFAVAA